MADLDSAAAAAAQSIADALVEVEDLSRAIAAAGEQIDGFAEELQGARGELDRAGQAIVAECGETGEALVQGAEELIDDVEAVHARADEVRDQLAALAGEAEKAMEEQRQRQREDIRGMMRNLADLGSGLGELRSRSEVFSARVTTKTDETQRFLAEEVTARLQATRADVEQRGAALHALVVEEAIPALEAAASELAGKVAEMQAELQQTIAGIGDRLDAAARQAADLVEAEREAAIDRLQKAVEAERAARETFQSTVNRVTASIESERQRLDAVRDQAVRAISAVDDGFRDVLDYFSRFSFVR